MHHSLAAFSARAFVRRFPIRWRRACIIVGCGLLPVASPAQPPLTLPRSARPAWLADEGLVMAGSWEPLLFRVRRDGAEGFIPTPEQLAGYRREQSPEMIAQLKALGVNFVMMHCYKGAGLTLERESMAEAKQFAHRCHDAGLRVGVYAYSGALLWEPLLKEIPSAWEWFVLDEHGEPEPYSRAPYRYRWNRNHPAAIAFYKGIVRYAVEDVKADLVHLDNYTTGPGFDGNSQRRFREYLSAKFSREQLEQMGVRDVKNAMPPRSDSANALLVRAWTDFRCQSLADAYAEISAYARSLRRDVLMEINPGGLPRRIGRAVDHGRLLPGGEAFWSEGAMKPWRGQGPLETNIAAYKLARRMDNMMFRYVTTPLQAAEAMAFNLDALGCIVWFEYGRLSDYPGEMGRPLAPERAPFVRFFRERRELFKHADVVADTAVWRSFASEVFGPDERATSAARVTDELIATRAAFQVIADVHLAELNRYRVLVLADCLAMSDTQVAQVRAFVDAGGRLCVIGPLATHDEWMRARERPALEDLPAEHVFRVAASKDVPSAVERALRDGTSLKITAQATPRGTSVGTVDSLLGLCAELTRRGDRQFVHLVNYREGTPAENVQVRLRVGPSHRARSVTLASPEQTADVPAEFRQEGEFVSFAVPKVGIYTIAAVATD